MARRSRWLRKLEREGRLEAVRVEQTDGTSRTFAAREFWFGLFLLGLDRAVGREPKPGIARAIDDALRSATPESVDMIHALAGERGEDLDFVQQVLSGGPEGEDFPDLSEQAKAERS